MSSPTETELTFAEKVQADKKSLLERAFSADLLKYSRNIIISKPIHNPLNKNENNDQKENTDSQTTNILTSKEFAEVFGDEDVDDSEEIFQKALKKAEELFEREMKIKETNPFYRSSREFENPRPLRARKLKSKFVRDSENIINTFRKSLMTGKEPQKFSSTSGFTSSNTQKSSRVNMKSLTKSVSIVNRPSRIRKYPIWKTTATNTPIFRAPTNPKWGKDRQLTPQLTNKNKMYTPGHINDWMDSIPSDDDIGSPPCKKTRSDITAHDLASNEDNFLSSTEKPLASSTPMNKLKINSKRLSPRPIESPVYSSSPMHSTTVHFTRSPPIAFPTPAYPCSPVHGTTVRFKSSPQKQMDSPDYSSTPMRSTTVRFRPSPPQHFIYSDGNSTVSSNSLILEENDFNQYKNNNFNSHAFYSSEDENEGNIHLEISPANVGNLNHQAPFFNEDFKNPREYEVFKKYKSGHLINENLEISPENIGKLNHQNPFFNEDYFKNSRKYEVFKEYESGHLINNDAYKEGNENITENSTNPKIFYENFVQNLKYNISNNYQMEVEYSMKLKYSK